MLISRGRFKAMLRDESVAYLNEQPVINSGLIGTNAVTYEKLQLPSTANVLLGVGDPIGSGYAEIACTAFARSILDDPDAATVQATLGLGTSAVYNVGTTIDDIVQLEDVGGNPGLPAVDGSQLTGLFVSPATTEGDLLVQGATVLERLAKGTSGQVLSILNDAVAWVDTVAQKDIEHTLWNGGVLTAEVNKHYVVNAQLVTTTATLPEAPPNGSLIAFSDFTGDFAINNLTINASGTDTIFNGLDQQVTLVNDFDLVGYVYFDGNWCVIKAQVFTDDSLQDVMTTRGDLIYRNNLNQTARLPVGSNGQVLKSNGVDLVWEDSVDAINLSYSATAAGATVTNSAGLGFNISLVSGGAAGLMAPSSYTKLLNIEANADVTDTVNVTAAGALMDSEITSLSGIKTMTIPDNVTISSFGATLIDDSDAATARTTLELGGAALLEAGTSANELVQLDGSGRLPAVDASQLTNLPNGFANPLTTRGDIIYRDATGNTTRLPLGTVGQVLKSDGSDIVWGNIVTSTNLNYTASPTNGVVTSDTGIDATLPLADGTNAGLLAPGDFTKLGNISVTGAVDLDTLGTAAFLDVGTGADQVVQLDGTGKLPAVDGSQLTGVSAQTFSHWDEGIGDTGINATVTVSNFYPIGAATNIDVAITPKGTGAFMLQVPDGTGAGGNKRGTNSIDLQILRDHNLMVASGNNSVVIGAKCTASADYCTAVGYYSEATTAVGAAAFGYSAAASGLYSVALGNSIASGERAMAIGDGATASGITSFAVNGSTASATNTVAMVYGAEATAIAALAFGNQAKATATYAIALGRFTDADASASVAIGHYSQTKGVLGRFAYACGNNSVEGDAQYGLFVFRGSTTTSTADRLTTNGGSGDATTTLTPATGTVLGVTVRVVGTVATASSIGDWEIKAAVKNVGGTVTIVHQTTTALVDEIVVDAVPVLEVISNVCAVKATGKASTTIRWVATAQFAENTYA